MPSGTLQALQEHQQLHPYGLQLTVFGFLHKQARRYLLDSAKSEVPGANGGKAARRKGGCGPSADQPPAPREKGSRPSRIAGLARRVSFRHGSWGKMGNEVTPRAGRADPGRNPTHVASRCPPPAPVRASLSPLRSSSPSHVARLPGAPHLPPPALFPGPPDAPALRLHAERQRPHLRHDPPRAPALPAGRKSAWQGPGAAILPWGGSDIRGAGPDHSIYPTAPRCPPPSLPGSSRSREKLG